MVNIKMHLDKLGLKVRDKVTGMEGVITCVSFDLYGCVQTIVHPGLDKDGNPREPKWFDIARLDILEPAPVMERPDFDFGPAAEGRKGPAEKPAFIKA